MLQVSSRLSMARVMATYSHNPAGLWTATHQMTMNGKCDGFTQSDFEACAKSAQMKRWRVAAILDEVRAAVKRWPECAAAAGVDDARRTHIGRAHRMVFAAG